MNINYSTIFFLILSLLDDIESLVAITANAVINAIHASHITTRVVASKAGLATFSSISHAILIIGIVGLSINIL